MQSKTQNRLVCTVLAFLMLLMSVSFTGISFKARAEGTSYVLEANTMKEASEGTFTDGQSVKAGTDDFFTIIYSAKSKIDTSSKTWTDGYSSGVRFNLGGKVTTENNAIKFTTGSAANVKVWWVEGGDNAERQMVIIDASGNVVAKTNDTNLAKNDPCVSTLQVPDAGTYFLGGDVGNNYIFKVEVTETAPSREYEFVSSVLPTASDAGVYKDGQSVKAGTDDYFTLYFSEKSKIDGSDKEFPDDTTGVAPRVNFGG